jgi:hypothetical protein
MMMTKKRKNDPLDWMHLYGLKSLRHCIHSNIVVVVDMSALKISRRRRRRRRRRRHCRHLAKGVVPTTTNAAPDKRRQTTTTSLQYFSCIEPLCSNNGDKNTRNVHTLTVVVVVVVVGNESCHFGKSR